MHRVTPPRREAVVARLPEERGDPVLECTPVLGGEGLLERSHELLRGELEALSRADVEVHGPQRLAVGVLEVCSHGVLMGRDDRFWASRES